MCETGRYDNIPRNERVCNVCNCKTIEDEIHFLLQTEPPTKICEVPWPRKIPDGFQKVRTSLDSCCREATATKIYFSDNKL